METTDSVSQARQLMPSFLTDVHTHIHKGIGLTSTLQVNLSWTNHDSDLCNILYGLMPVLMPTSRTSNGTSFFPHPLTSSQCKGQHFFYTGSSTPESSMPDDCQQCQGTKRHPEQHSKTCKICAHILYVQDYYTTTRDLFVRQENKTMA